MKTAIMLAFCVDSRRQLWEMFSYKGRVQNLVRMRKFLSVVFLNSNFNMTFFLYFLPAMVRRTPPDGVQSYPIERALDNVSPKGIHQALFAGRQGR